MLKKCLAVSAISILALNVSAQPDFDELVVFGDSLLDTGNFGRNGDGNSLRATNLLLGGTEQEYAPIAPQFLADYLGLDLAPAVEGGTNYAVGGNKTLNVLGTIVDPALAGVPVDPSFVAGVVVPPQETILGVPPFAPATASASPYLTSTFGVVGPNSLVLIDGGGNDIAAITVGIAPFDAAAATAAVTNSAQVLVTGIGALDAAGANYIILANAPDLGNIALGRAAELSSPGAAAGFTAISTGYNGALSTFLTLGVPDANIIPFDIEGAVDYVLNNAGDFGIANGSIDLGGGLLFDEQYMCYDGSSGQCVEHPVYGISQATADPRRLFFNDALHPTEIASEIVGAYLVDIIAAPGKVGLLPELSLSAGREQADAVANQLRQSRWQAAKPGLFVTGNFVEGEYGDRAATELESQSLTVGRTFVASESLIYGLAFTASNQELDTNGIDIEADTWGLTGMLGFRRGNAFIDATLGLSVLTYDGIKRDIDLGVQSLTAEGDTEGHAWTVSILGGIDVLGSESWHLAPVIGVTVINSTVDDYTESGGEFSNYAWGEQRRESLQWKYGLVGSGQLTDSLTVYGEVLGAREQEDNPQDISVRNTSLDFQSYRLPSFEADGSVIIETKLGAAMSISNGARVDVNFSHSTRDDDYQQLLVSYSHPL